MNMQVLLTQQDYFQYYDAVRNLEVVHEHGIENVSVEGEDRLVGFNAPTIFQKLIEMFKSICSGNKRTENQYWTETKYQMLINNIRTINGIHQKMAACPFEAVHVNQFNSANSLKYNTLMIGRLYDRMIELMEEWNQQINHPSLLSRLINKINAFLGRSLANQFQQPALHIKLCENETLATIDGEKIILQDCYSNSADYTEVEFLIGWEEFLEARSREATFSQSYIRWPRSSPSKPQRFTKYFSREIKRVFKDITERSYRPEALFHFVHVIMHHFKPFMGDSEFVLASADDYFGKYLNANSATISIEEFEGWVDEYCRLISLLQGKDAHKAVAGYCLSHFKTMLVAHPDQRDRLQNMAKTKLEAFGITDREIFQ